MRVRCLRLAPALLISAAPAFAQEQLIVVTGRGLEPGRGEEVFGVVTLGRERLATAPSTRLEDVLRDVPGFQLFRRSDARSANPTSQGATFRGLGGNASSRALLILDGVPQSDPFGGWISWPAFDPRRLGQIRVVRGGGTGVNGPGALAGTIELASAAPDEMGGGTASLAYGSRDGVDGFAGLGIPLGSGFLALSGAWATGNGFVPVVAAQRGAADRPAPYRQGSLALRAVAPVTAATELQASLAAFSDRRERGTAFSEIAADGADASLRLVGRGRLPFSLLGYVQLRDFSNRFAAVSDDRSSATLVLDQYSVPSTGLGARFELRPALGEAELRLGADWRATQGRTQELFSFAAGSPTRARAAGGRTSTLGAFAELGLETGAFTLGGGGRIDHWRIEEGFLSERMLAGSAPLTGTLFPDRRGWEATGRAGAAWQVSRRVSARAAAYRGWRLPTLNELYRPFRIGADATAANAALAPERLEGAEAGIEWRAGESGRIGENWRIGITVFANRLDGAIANVTLGEGPGLFPGVGFVAGQFRQRRNVEAVVSRGLEADASLALGRWRITGGYSYADAALRAGGDAAPLDRLRPAQAPRHSASATVSWHGARGRIASLTGRYVGAGYEDDLNRQRLPDALTFDAVVVAPLSAGLAIEARGENLTDTRVVASISSEGIVERATPRTLWIGLRWRGRD